VPRSTGAAKEINAKHTDERAERAYDGLLRTIPAGHESDPG
jgi:hypothetical protein